MQLQAGHRSERDTGHRPAGADDLRRRQRRTARAHERFQQQPTGKVASETKRHKRSYIHIPIVPDGSCSCRHQVRPFVQPADRGSCASISISYLIRWTQCRELRQHSSLRVTMPGTHKTPARLASIRERADVRFTSLTFLAHATMDLHSQHTIAQDFVPNTFSSVPLLISDPVIPVSSGARTCFLADSLGGASSKRSSMALGFCFCDSHGVPPRSGQWPSSPRLSR